MRTMWMSLALAGCQLSAPGVCSPERPFPYPSGSPYAGVHGDAGNSDVVPCDLSTAFEPGWHALAGLGITQPNTFSPNGRTTYVTSTHPDPDGCRLHAIEVRTGEVRWCASYPPGIAASAVEVDEDGDLYVTWEGTVTSLDPDGATRWETSLGSDTPPWGIHFSPQGHVVTVTPEGTLYLLDRSDGAVLDKLSIPDQWGLQAPDSPDLLLDVEQVFPPAVLGDIETMFGPAGTAEADAGASTFLGSGAFVDNTIAIAPNGSIYVIGGGVDADSGALVQVYIEGDALRAGWLAHTDRGSATSPSVSEDGRYLVIGDGASLDRFLFPDTPTGHVRVADLHRCDGNTDADPDPGVCAFVAEHPLERGPMMGAPALLPDGTTVFYELALDHAATSDARDVVALGPDGQITWEAVLPDDREWTSVITVTNDHLVGTATRIEPSSEAFFQLVFPQSSDSALMVLDRHTGRTVFSAPVPDDSAATVTVGPDGELYVGMLGMISLMSIDVRPTLGLLRFNPVSTE